MNNTTRSLSSETIPRETPIWFGEFVMLAHHDRKTPRFVRLIQALNRNNVVCRLDPITDNLRCIHNYFELSETEAANVSVASELQAMSATSNGFTNDEICVMLEAVCIE